MITENSRPFWDAARRHELGLQKCNNCGKHWYPSGPVCPFCWSRDYVWAKLSGRGKVSSWVVFHQRYLESFSEDIPYNMAQVELEEGPRITTNLVGVKNEDITMDMSVYVVFDDVTPDLTLPKFRPNM